MNPIFKALIIVQYEQTSHLPENRWILSGTTRFLTRDGGTQKRLPDFFRQMEG